MNRERGGDAGDDLYAALGLPAGATEEDITRAYRRLVREHHPDANSDAQTARFTDLTDAYDVLHDASRRRSYDNTRRARANAAASTGGTRIPVTRRNSPSNVGARESSPIEVVLTFEQSALGATIRVTVDVEGPCPTCSGHGRAPGARCPVCGGGGATVRTSGGITIRTTCQRCNGARRQPPTLCAVCSGTGRTKTSREVPVRIPPGVENGSTLRLPPVNGAGEEQIAVVRVEPHRYFGRRGRDVTLRLPLTVAEAALGGVVTIPTLTGAVAVRIPAGTAHGRVLRVRGRGVPGGDHPGDLLATVEVVIPTSVTAEQRVALEAFAAATESPRTHFES
jgi:molecular chaperone DnaJ